MRASDVNTDGVVNILDLTIIAAHLGTTAIEDQTPNPDVNGDGSINILDLTLAARHLGKTVRPPVSLVSVVPAIDSELEIDATITLVFDNILEDVAVDTGIATVTGNIVRIKGPFDPGPLALTITWADGNRQLGYIVRDPDTEPSKVINVNPVSGSEIDPDDTITVTFDNIPEDVTVSAGVATIDGKTVKITGPFERGLFIFSITWADQTLSLGYIVGSLDTEPPKITGGTFKDGDKNVIPNTINNRGRIEVAFNESVSGTIALQTESGDDVGWRGKVDGNRGTLTLVKGKELKGETTYVIAGSVRDAADNSTDISITFTTASKPIAPRNPINVNDANFDTVVLEYPLPIVVEFKTDWCPFCQRMRPVVAEIAAENRETFAVAKLDADDSKKTTQKYGIKGVPTYIVFQDGEVVGRFGGAMSKTELLQDILSAIGAE